MSASRLPDSVAGKTIFGMVAERARQRPNAHALTATSAYGGEERVTYRQLCHMASRLADGLRQQGVGLADHVGVMLDNDAGLEAAVTMLALHRLGAVVVPVNTRFATAELVYVLNKARCSTLVAPAGLWRKLADVLPQLPAIHVTLSTGPLPDASGGLGEVPHDWRAILAKGDANAGGWPEISPDSMSEILFTSGTTAHPKGAVMTHSRSLTAAYGFAAAMSLDENDVFGSFFPFFTTAALHCLLLPSWFAGAAAVVDPRLEIEEVLARIERERMTKYIGAPAFYIFLLDAYDPARHDLSGIRMFDYGGAAMPVEIIRRLAETFPWIELRQTWGMTETGPSGAVLLGKDALRKAGAVGQPWPLTEIRIVDDAYAPLATGVTGEIAVRSPAVMREYYDQPELTRETLRDGWLMTGDIGFIDDEGYLHHVDRKKDMIIRGGHNIGSLEVEEALFQHPAVQDVSVVAAPHPKLGEDIHAFIVLRPGLQTDAAGLRAFCIDRLADYKIPRRMTFLDDMPRGPLGKVLKQELRRRAVEAAAAPAANV